MSDEVRALVPRAKLELVARDIVEFLPELADAGPGTQLALAYLTVQYGLDPFLGDLWAIPRKEQNKTVGWSLMLGIRGLRKIALRSRQYDGRSFRWLTEDEARHLGVNLGKGDKAVACVVRRRDVKEPFVGYGVVYPGDKSRMNHGQLANLRAERDALKAAFSAEIFGFETQLGTEKVIIAEVEDVEEDDEGNGVITYPTRNEKHVSSRPKVEYDQVELGPLGEGVARGPEPHWIADAHTCRHFWAWTGQDLGLSNDEVHQALGVESVHDFPGTKREAMDRILAWVAEQSKAKVEPHSAKQDIEDLFGPQEG